MVLFKIILACFFLCFAFFPAETFAQMYDSDEPINCSFNKEAIIKLNPPFQGGSGMWKVNFGENDRQEEFKSAIMLEEWQVALAGEVYDKPQILDKKKPEEQEDIRQNMKLLLVKLNHRGRTVWKTVQEIKGLNNVVKIMSSNDGSYVIGGNVKDENNPTSIWFGHFNQNGQLLSENWFQDKAADLFLNDMVLYTNDDLKKQNIRYALAVQYQHKRGNFPLHARLYLVDKNFKTIAHRAFVTGLENGIHRLKIVPEHHMILAGGYAMGEDGRKNGWVSGLDENGNIRWQKQHPRGAGAQINVLDYYPGDTLITAGYAEPLTKGDTRAGWVMRLDAKNGTTVWQRYFSGNMHYSITDMRVNPDGVLSFLMNATANRKSPQVDFVRIMNVSSGGLLIREESYFNEEGVRGNQLLEGSRGEHVVIGDVIQGYLMDNPDSMAAGANAQIPDNSLQGWLMVGRRAQNYNDPCLLVGGRSEE